MFKAQHRRMNRVVALKVLPRAALQSPGRIARFYQEATAAARLSHPNIVAAYDADEHAGHHYLVMEYVDGRDLSALVKEHGPLPIPVAVHCVLEAAEALEYAHRHGVVHRDVKPSNLLLAKDGSVKLLDLGVARVTAFDDPFGAAPAERLTQTGQVMGTVDYMAPEQAEDMRVADHRADIYALGCTLFRLLTGQPPYVRDTVVQVILAHREQPIPSIRAARPEVSKAIDGVFRKAVAKRPEERYQSVSELIAALREAVGESPRAARAAVEPLSDEAVADVLRSLAATETTAAPGGTLFDDEWPGPPPPLERKPARRRRLGPDLSLWRQPYVALGLVAVAAVVMMLVMLIRVLSP